MAFYTTVQHQEANAMDVNAVNTLNARKGRQPNTFKAGVDTERDTTDIGICGCADTTLLYRICLRGHLRVEDL